MMMANWEKLNSKFNQIIDNMSNEDWNKWSSERMAKKAMRNSEMLLRAKLQEEKIILSSIIGCNISSHTGYSSSVNIITNSLFTGLVLRSEPEYPIAA
jgi:hypothetical protein